MRCCVVLLFASLPAFLFGQATTNRSYVQTTSPPLVTTPTLTLGNGITPSVITYDGAVVMVTPGTAPSVQPYGTASAEAQAGTEGPGNQAQGQLFDFMSSGEDSAYRAGETDFASLGEVTRNLKINHPEVAHRTFTNSDIPAAEPGTGIIRADTPHGPIRPKQNYGVQPEAVITNQPDDQRPASRSSRNNLASANVGSAARSTAATIPSLRSAVERGKDSMSGDANQLPATDPQE